VDNNYIINNKTVDAFMNDWKTGVCSNIFEIMKTNTNVTTRKCFL